MQGVGAAAGDPNSSQVSTFLLLSALPHPANPLPTAPHTPTPHLSNHPPLPFPSSPWPLVPPSRLSPPPLHPPTHPPTQDGCICNLDRLEAALPHFRTASRHLLPAIIGKLLMFAATTALLLHGAAMWGRATTEGKLLRGHATGAVAAAVGGGGRPGSHPVALDPSTPAAV